MYILDQDVSELDKHISDAMHRIERLYYETDGKCYLSFSGGKDSTIVLAVIRLCEEIGTILKNAIPAVFCDTKIELDATVDFVHWVKNNWYNVQIIKTEKSFAQVIKEYGKPFRSKMKSKGLHYYITNPAYLTARALYDDSVCKSSKMRLSNKDFHVLHSNFSIQISDKCCDVMKKKPFTKYGKDNGMRGYFSGMRMFEGGKRHIVFEKRIKSGDKRPCTHVSDGVTSVSPIFDWTDEICEEFIQKYSVPLSRAYTEYGETRTGCFLCPYGLNVDKRLETLHTYEPNKYKAALHFLKDVYIAQGVELPFDLDYMKEYKEKWIEYEQMRYEMLKKYRPDCMICKKYEKEHGQPAQKKLF